MTVKSLLFLLRQPGNTVHAREALDSVLVAGVFDQHVSVLFKDDGVWQLAGNALQSQNTSEKTADLISSLADYGVTAIYACERSLSARKLAQSDLLLPVEILSNAAQTDLLTRQDAVVND